MKIYISDDGDARKFEADAEYKSNLQSEQELGRGRRK